MCDFPLPYKPHINIENGMFVLWNNLVSATDIDPEDVCLAKEVFPSRLCCGRRLASQALSTSAEKRAASLILFLNVASPYWLHSSSDCKRYSWSSIVGKGQLSCCELSPPSRDISANASGSAPYECLSRPG